MVWPSNSIIIMAKTPIKRVINLKQTKMKKLILISALMIGLTSYGITHKHDVKSDKSSIEALNELKTINVAIAKIIHPNMMSVPKDKIKELNSLMAYRDQLVVSLEATNLEMLAGLRKWYYWQCAKCAGFYWCGSCGSGNCCGWASGSMCPSCGSLEGYCRNTFCN